VRLIEDSALIRAECGKELLIVRLVQVWNVDAMDSAASRIDTSEYYDVLSSANELQPFCEYYPSFLAPHPKSYHSYCE
jgi:hypothetical protein